VPDTNASLRDRLLERPIVPITIPTTSADVPVTSKACLLVGWSFFETSGSAGATAEIRSGDASTGTYVAGVSLASGGAASQHAANEGILCEGGISVHRLGGSFRGSVWIRI
jgi:hypothetical protein